MSKITGFIDTAKGVSQTAIDRVGVKKGRSLHITGASCLGNTFVGFGKLVMGIVSLSFFTCASAFYTFGMVAAKIIALMGIIKEENTEKQYNYYRLSGIVLIISSVMYIGYSCRLIFHPQTSKYHMYVALAIATFTFTELTLNIRGVIIERNNKTPLIHAIKMINLASSMICLVLTQSALLSISSDKAAAMSMANAFIGILMGISATVIGICLIIRINKIQNNTNYGKAFRKLKKLMKKEHIKLKIKPAKYISSDEYSELYVKLKNTESLEKFDKLCTTANKKLDFVVIEIDMYRLKTSQNER